MFAVISTLSITFWVAISFALLERRDNAEFIYWSSVECRGLNVEGEGKKSRVRVKSRG